MGVNKFIENGSENQFNRTPYYVDPIRLSTHFQQIDFSRFGHFSEQPEEDVLVEDEVDTGSGEVAHLLVYNDDHNSFDWVIECFMEILQHTNQQAEQLALLIHLKGKATVKTAPRNVLQPKKEALVDRGLSAVIEGERI